jgi:steroid delta-isomerase-like uncharacterized protein
MSEGTGLFKRFYEDVLGKGEINLLDELVADDVVDHEDALPGQPPGREGVKFFVKAVRDAFPDIRPAAMGPLLTDGDLEAGYFVMTGTHEGDFLGVPATGKSVEIKGLDIIRVKDGKVTEHWGATDTMSLMEQLGALPE